MSKGSVTQSEELRQVNVSAWATKFAELNDVRDQREVATLIALMDKIQAYEVEEAMDIMVQRIVAIQEAKEKAGSWDKASKFEFVGPTGEVYGHPVGVLAGVLRRLQRCSGLRNAFDSPGSLQFCSRCCLMFWCRVEVRFVVCCDGLLYRSPRTGPRGWRRAKSLCFLYSIWRFVLGVAVSELAGLRSSLASCSPTF